MDRTDYLDRLLAKYSGTFDIYKPYVVHGREYPAYGYFFSCVEKYVLVREANLWSSKSYEHVMFLSEEKCTLETLEEVKQLWEGYMEPELVCHGTKEPEENHMYSYLSVIVIAEHKLEREIAKQIRKLNFEKGYRFNMRGYSQGHIAVVSMEDEKVYANFVGRKLKTVLKETFHDVRNGRIGFEELLKKTESQAFTQTVIE
ncbi:MAG: hypothetical protein PHE02_07615 [Lachnospiraceae bacterium]|nr:hypothetical protein [Lachnospiraceae bacterium]